MIKKIIIAIILVMVFMGCTECDPHDLMPAQLINLSVDKFGEDIVLSWENVESGNSYEIHVAKNGHTFGDLITTAVDAESENFRSLDSGEYSFSMQALNNSGDRSVPVNVEYTVEADPVELPLPVSDLDVNIVNNEMVFTWTNNADNATGNHVELVGPVNGTDDIAADADTYNFGTPTPGDYTFNVNPVNSAGDGDVRSISFNIAHPQNPAIADILATLCANGKTVSEMIVEHGFEVYPGGNAPNVEGSYSATDAAYEFSDGGSGTFDYNTTLNVQTSIGEITRETNIYIPAATNQETYISGNGNDFTIWSKTNWDNASQINLVEITTGTILPSGNIYNAKELHILISAAIPYRAWAKISTGFILIP